MRTVIFFGLVLIVDAIRDAAELAELGNGLTTTIAGILIVAVAMDLIDFFKSVTE